MSTTVPEFRTLSDRVDHALVRSVEELLPMLRENAADAERLRRLPEAGIEALETLGITRLTVPRRFGGLQVNAATEFEVVRTIARACGSTSWVMALYAVCGYWAALFPDPVQELVFSGPGARVAGVSAPGGTLVPTEGGYLLTGRWPWNTGVLHATWNVLAAVLAHEDGANEPYLAVVPTTQMEIIDDWHMSAMQGTGSSTSVARDVFVPHDRALPLPGLLRGDHASAANAGVVEYSYAVFPFLLSASVGTPIGIAQGALESFVERAPERATSFENPARQATSPVTQFQLGEISMSIEAALAISRDTIAALERHAVQGTPMSTEERIRVRAAVAYATRLSADATTRGPAPGPTAASTTATTARVTATTTTAAVTPVAATPAVRSSGPRKRPRPAARR
ncbi:alkylation response protein AidB-like acyl-CoA dehydrogenase [Streptomyces griseochromogenes]|uniref:Alkylation response protein AidB-like acyl-CoA dehydrogenase n=1 Tax=Streptomyces griseochromogenes TaxID=68214 RepID=A0A1B1ATW7_9ACTN|nr:acyl-CoA dehydrogenase family protein [Streptomyces griseochromogenes]ANP50029.1 hypothetical protein AVL59_10775 [Streptomyces griseochromogenes]MBP2048362.1 alkylation response protein AidB-like acyl-CoA dehydrogenase [Streptomyces griseochromogenes]